MCHGNDAGGMMGGGTMGRGGVWPFVAGVLAGLLLASAVAGTVWFTRRQDET